MDKKSLDIIVEEFFDTGKLVLNEYGKFPYVDKPLAQFYGKIKSDYDFIIRQLTSHRKFSDIESIFNRFIEKWRELVNNERQLSEFLGVNNLDQNFIEDVNFLSNNFEELKLIHKKFIEKKDVKWGDNPENLNILQNLLSAVKDLGGDDYVARFVPVNITTILNDKIEELDVELKSFETPITKEKNRKNQIEQDNNSDLPLLSIDTPIDTDSEKQNLKILQYVLLNNFNADEDMDEELRKELMKEIEKVEFGEYTELYVQLLQKKYRLEQSGMVNKSVWNLVLGLLSDRETAKLNDLGVSDELKDILSFQYGRNNNNKQKLNKLSSLRLFNNLLRFGVYKIEHKRSDDDIERDLMGMANDFVVGKDSTGKNITIINQLEKELKDINEFIEDIKTIWIKRKPNKPLKTFFKKQPIKKKIEEKKKIVKDIEKYKKFESIIRRYSGGGLNKDDAIQEYLDIRKKTDERTVKGLFGGLKKVFDKAIEAKDYSLDAINTILTKINHTLYKVNDSDIQQTTKNNKSKKALRTIMDKVDNAMDVEDIQDTLDNVNTKTFQHLKYELSFCECRNDDDEMLRHYFRDCGSSIGNKSRLLPNNTLLKELIDSDSDWKDCVVTLYDEIIRGDGRSIQKHDRGKED